MRREKLERIFPAFQEIQDETLRVKSDVIFCERKEWIGIEERSSA